MLLDNRYFIYVNIKGKAEKIRQISRLFYDNEVVEEESEKKVDKCVSKPADNDSTLVEEVEGGEEQEFLKLLDMLPAPYTIILESLYVDPSYRDTYYMYFSNQHFDVKRNSKRLSFFKGRITRCTFFNESTKTKKHLQNVYMGSCVINPLVKGSIGRTLINPKYLLDVAGRDAYLRVSEYKSHILGKTLYVKAFPYRMQDEETTRCTEVTVLNLLDYYSNTYKDYRTITPSEILISEQKHNHERVLPSRGISYPVLTKILSDFGFSPRLYDLKSIDTNNLSRVTQSDEIKRIMHYYTESAIPVAINLAPIAGNGSGHSVICIGHGGRRKDLFTRADQNKIISWQNKDVCHPLINSADYYNEYVIIDDNQVGYQLREFENLSMHSNLQVENIAVPLYKRMFMEATDAATIARMLLQDDEFYGIHKWCDEYLDKQEDVIFRLFMASSCSLKEFRANTVENEFVRELYAITPMPRFVWVCELYRKDEYMQENENIHAFGELIIDATSAASRSYRSLIVMHYLGVFGVRTPDTEETYYKIADDTAFIGYRNNLENVLKM